MVNQTILKKSLCGVSGGVAFYLLYKSGIYWPFAGGLSLAFFIGTSLLLNPSKKQNTLVRNIEEPINELENLLNDALNKVKIIQSYKGKLRNHRIDEKVEEFEEITEAVIKTVKNDSTSIKNVKKLFEYYLGKPITLLSFYAEVQEQKINLEEKSVKLRKVESLLLSLAKAYQKQYLELLKDRNFDLEVEMEVIGNEMKSEGF